MRTRLGGALLALSLWVPPLFGQQPDRHTAVEVHNETIGVQDPRRRNLLSSQIDESRDVGTRVSIGGELIVAPGPTLWPLAVVRVEPLPRRGLGLSLGGGVDLSALFAGTVFGSADLGVAYAFPLSDSTVLLPRAGLAGIGGIPPGGGGGVFGPMVGIGVGDSNRGMRLDYTIRKFGAFSDPRDGLTHGFAITLRLGGS